MSEWKKNPGYLPRDAKGKRVFVRLANGSEPRSNDPPYPPGWAADGGHQRTRWTKTGDPFDITEYRVL